MKPAIQKFHSSLEKIDAFSGMHAPELGEITGLWGETVSFQITCTFDRDYHDDSYGILSVEAPGCQAEVFLVEGAACSYPCYPDSTGAYLTKVPGLIPDILNPYHGTPVRISSGICRVFWVDIAIPAGAQSGSVTVQLRDRRGNLQSCEQLRLEVVGQELPKQQVRHTEWFYNDCLCQQYGCRMYSDRFFEIARGYIAMAAAHGMDTLLTPVFTPSLDIEPDCRRMPGQLVKITRGPEGWGFDFALLERWVRMAQECGIEYFEIAPFFTQWGARCPAEIYEQTPEGEKTILGWGDPATGEAYGAFLADFLPKLIGELKRLGIKEKTYFHVSDEPTLEQLDNYRAAREMIVPYLEGCPVIDALSSFQFYQQGLVSIPVVAENHLEPFLAERGAGEIWTYSCCSQHQLVPNFFMAMPSSRGRILGVLLYQEDLKGFLRWGYNFWNSQYSKEAVDPYRVTDAGYGFPSGDSFLVYPGADGTPVPSIRLKVMRDAFQDYRALQLLQERLGRDGVIDWLRQTLGELSFTSYPTDAEALPAMRKALHEQLKKGN